MDSIIEVQRNTHEEIERFDQALADILSRPQVTHRTNLIAEHKASAVLDRMHARMITLNSHYMDETGPRSQELEQLSSGGAPDDLTDFYSKLKKIKDHHHKYPDSATNGFVLELSGLLEGGVPGTAEDGVEADDPFSRLFSGEESFGRYVDLNANHAEYNNLKGLGKRFLPYLQYLTILAEIGAPDAAGQLGAELNEKTRFSKEYETYLSNLHAYLVSFVKRTRPLQPHAQLQSDAEAEFDKLWEQNQIQGWDASGAPGVTNGSTPAEGIWCPACQRHYAKQTVYDAHLTSKKHLKAAARTTQQNPPPNANGSLAPTPDASTSTSRKHIKTYRAALLTHLLGPLLKTLYGTMLETKANVERRFSLTAHERELELEEPEVDIAPVTTGDAAEGAPAMEEEEEEERIYNPLKLPLGWDGKPIPYWLYKLHGLGVEYRCEICSDHVYMGRKNFDRHFQESRHAFGMRALGLPNTKHFHEITRIEDALSLAERLKQEGKQEIFQNETMEELEDEEGNVYNKKTYEDLKKQGLI
ncbi:hypothetical protein BDV93DRAFT_487253 [Ceratobasidium sp. AG-I]|nr:hypothetical protein BDV93DRAFT_487253 [Ceratobasidium sp. AG-I]